MKLADDTAIGPQRGAVLDPVERISEVLFGLFMVLTFTGTISAAEAGRDEVRTMVAAALGCNIAWGFVDGVMYVLRNLVDRGRKATLLRAVQAARRPEDARRVIAGELGAVGEVLGADGYERLRHALLAMPTPPIGRVRLQRADFYGALGVFALVFASTLPVVLPFVFVDDLGLAKRVSAAIAIVMLYLCGHGWARYAGLSPLRTGLVMVLLGVAIEAVVIALGG